MILEHVIAACGEASSQGPETTARISALLYPNSLRIFYFSDRVPSFKVPYQVK